MDYHKAFRIEPGQRVDLKNFSPRMTDHHESKSEALVRTEELKQRMDHLQFCMYAEQKHSLLICLQAPDAGGKDGVIRNVFTAMNPQGCRVVSFKQPSSLELAHNFLWRIEQQTPRRGEVAIFNRSHYEDVLIVRVHNLVDRAIWSQRYDQINDFERRLAAHGTQVLKFFLHISKEEQLERFKDRLDDPERHWKISTADYSERDHWTAYEEAYAEALSRCSTKESPWYVIPSDQKWFRNRAISQIIVDKMEELNFQLPKPTVNIEAIRQMYVEASSHMKKKKKRSP